ncbi:sporulation integral membrane protein YlbJ [Paenibacillus anaericanus]|uniref:nucleoside recognition domain-containing protein n=1 Tax=Paenibacillus anaericanus TaxID=170367 RepID=UPI00277E79A7|nr:nucleoside recognition domain-containing protein [Paenibacillus anaericanus]MDQ0091693.1 sporulation integral membrane protein YlbJ [Paenibacillus anaericanus]
MNRDNSVTGSHSLALATTIGLGAIAALLVFSIVYAPAATFQASGQGLTIWWRIVFPAMLPFLVLSQILLAGGFAQGLGTLLDPFTRKALGLPGIAGWVLPLGMTAGFPAAAEATATLYKQGKISTLEAEKLAGAAHFCSPVLLIVVVGTGFLGVPGLGLLLLVVHWAAGLAAGMTLHFFTPSKQKKTTTKKLKTQEQSKRASSRLKLAIRNMEEVRREDGRGFGKLLGDSVTSAVQTMMVTGGFMLIFAVVIQVISSFLPTEILAFPIAGLLEVHLGAYSATKLDLTPALQSALLGAALGWSGLCATLQVRAILGPIGIKGRYFLINRMLHGIYAYIFTLLLWKPLTLLTGVLPVNKEIERSGVLTKSIEAILPNWNQVMAIFEWQVWLLGLLVGLFLLLGLFWRRHMDT